jgi:hypothetical protein
MWSAIAIVALVTINEDQISLLPTFIFGKDENRTIETPSI